MARTAAVTQQQVINCTVLRDGFRPTVVGCFPTTDMQTSPPLTSGHLDIKYAQCAKKNLGAIFHIALYRVWASQAHKRASLRPNDAPKEQLSSKVAKFAGEMTFFIQLMIFFAIL